MAAAAPERMRLAGRAATLPPGPGSIPTTGRVARPLVLALLLASSAVTSGKGAGKTREAAGAGPERGKGRPGSRVGADVCAGPGLCRRCWGVSRRP